MRVKSLQITGFKSFVDKTVFTFKPGITGIVGPNGCGKSNVVDAIRWAMGEQSPRRLRGKGMDDVIFAGAEGRSPIGMAEVVLTFDNADGQAPPIYAGYTEIQVSRRLYRSGESEYLINKVACRMRDVLDFFRDTGIGTKGYTIVEQGRIAEIVSAKPEERRALIEEAAGISKYKARRREAERKLEATEQNLLRVSDVVGEIKRQISSIERQARKAARYKRLRERQRLLELSLAAEDRDVLLGKIEDARRRSVELRDSLAVAETLLSEREATVEADKLALAEQERALTEGSEALFQLRAGIKELESRISYERRERASLAEANAARQTERERLDERLAAAREESERLADELRSVEATLESASEALASAEGDATAAAESLRTQEAEREGASNALVEALTRIGRAEDRLAALGERRTELDRSLRGTDEQIEVQQSVAGEVGHEQQSLEEGLRQLLAERDRLGGALRGALDGHAAAADRAERSDQRLADAREERERLAARLASLQEMLAQRDDLADATRHLIEGDTDARRRFGLRDLVRDVLDPDPEVEVALAAILSDRADGLVVEHVDGALQALRALRDGAVGRGVFVVDSATDEIGAGFVPLGEPLLGRVRPRPGYEGVARALLSRVNLVDDLRLALDRYGAGQLPCTFVTRAGDVLTPEGVIRGGSPPGVQTRASRKQEIEGLEGSLARLEATVSERSSEQRESRAALAHATEELENLRSRHHTAALAVANHEKDLERTRERAKAIVEAEERRAAERARLLGEQEERAAEETRLNAELVQARELRTTCQQALDALGLRVAAAARENTRLGAVLAERRVQHDTRAETRDRLREAAERAQATVTETSDWIEQRAEEIRAAEERRETLAASISAAELQLADELRSEEAARVQSDQSRDRWEQAAARVRELEEGVRELHASLNAQRESAQEADLGLRQCQLELEHLVTQVRDRWSVDIASWKPPVPALDAAPAVEEDGSRAEGDAEEAALVEGGAPGAETDGEAATGPDEEAEARDAQREARANADLLARPVAERRKVLEDLRSKLQSLGDVNLGAIEEHEELRERFRFLTDQKGDLENSVAQLRDAIGRINRTSRKRFRETFDAVNERFEKNFPRLFRGGRASLTLTESEDVLEAGIEIMAQPPGKRLQSVNLLSGGEKTMTAIALLVSVFQVRPSPFFLLDEVDAALDDANVGRFNEIVAELSQDSQFLLITHNKRTIEIADLLYGVTMEERGVSKLVGVELS